MKTNTIIMALVGLLFISFCSCDPLIIEPDNGKTPSESTDPGSSSSSTTNPNAVNGHLPGKFSVSNSKKVYFSQGNLLYQASTNTYMLAPQQYFVVGGKYEGNISHDKVKCNNELASESYDGWIDCFFFGTGDKPWSRDFTYNLYTTYHEWGDNPIKNGGNKAKQWRTLTMDEWMYLTQGRKNANKLMGVCKIENVRYHYNLDSWGEAHAIILLPDDWKGVSGITINTLADRGWKWNGDNDPPYWWGEDYHYNDNVFKVSEYKQLEKAGAVFLICTGQYSPNATYFEESIDKGEYWSSSSLAGWMGDDEIRGYALSFTMREIWDVYPSLVYSGKSVRLVQDVK